MAGNMNLMCCAVESAVVATMPETLTLGLMSTALTLYRLELLT